jgi:SAM-dependent methyltransferase
MTARNYNQESKPLDSKKYNYDFDALVRKYMFRCWEKYFDGGAALEIGCYHGDSTIILSEYFDALTVVEPSSECIKIAAKKVDKSVDFLNSTVENLLSTKRFKHIFLVNTLEHCDDPVILLSKVRELLTEDGKFYVLVPNADAPSRILASFMGLVDYSTAVTKNEYIHGHRRTYSFDVLNRDVTSAGFEVLDRGGILYKGMANYQIDLALNAGILSESYIEACYQYGQMFAHQAASIYLVAKVK